MIALDTSVLVCYLTGDDSEQQADANALLNRLTPADPGFVSREVTVELVLVLSRSYGLSRKRIADILEQLLDTSGLLFEGAIEIGCAAVDYARGGAEFADHLILAAAERAGAQPLFTFDRKVSRLDGAFPVPKAHEMRNSPREDPPVSALRPTELFAGHQLDHVLEDRRAAVRREIDQSDPNTINVDSLVSEHRIEEIRLDEANIRSRAVTKDMDASRFPNTHAHRKGEECVVPGLEVTYRVPFTGPSFPFECKMQVYSSLPIFAGLSAHELRFVLGRPWSDSIAEMSEEFRATLSVLKELLEHVNGRVRDFNRWLPVAASGFLSERRRVQRQIGSLGYEPE